MKSRIINMGDYTMDEQDRALQQLFAAEPLQDDGFSTRVMKRVRRRVLLQRLLLPIAVLFGGLVAVGPAVSLLSQLPELMGSAPALAGHMQEALGPVALSLISFLPPVAVVLVALRLIDE